MRNGQYTLIIAPPGYPGKRYRGRYAYEHRVVYWQTHGVLPPKNHVHHKNEQKRDNRPDNLGCLTPREHAVHHHAHGEEHQIRHGITGYTHDKCRCDTCRAVWNAHCLKYQREWRRKRKMLVVS